MSRRSLVAHVAWAAILCTVLCFSPASGFGQERDHDIVPEDYFDIASMGRVALSPDGSLCAYTETRWGPEADDGRQTDLWVVDLERREPRRLTFDGFGARDPAWSPDGRWIYFRGADPHGTAEQPPHDGSNQVWRVEAGGGTPFPVTRVKDGIEAFRLARDGSALYYTTSETVHDEDPFKALRKEFGDLEYGHGVRELNPVFKLDLGSWRATQVLAAERVIHEMALSADGSRLALITTTDNELIHVEGWSQVEVLHLATGELERVTPADWRQDHPSPFGWLSELAWSDDGTALAFTIAYDGYPQQIWVAEWRAGTATLRRLDRPAGVTFEGSLSWRPGTHDLAFLGEEQARIRVYLIENAAGGGRQRSSVLTAGDVVAGGYDFSDNGQTLVVTLATTTQLEDLFVVDGGEYRRITNLNPQVDRWKLPQISHITWTGADGDQVGGILELPPGYESDDGPLPLVVELHGGPTSATRLQLRLWIYGRALMPARGYALLSPNYHGSTGYGDEFLTKLIGRENEIEVKDISTGIDALIEQGIADPERIGVMGWSNGGFLTNCMIAAEPERFKAASSGAGVLDQVIQWGTEDTPGHVINYMAGNLPWQSPQRYIAASPLYRLDRVTTPTIIHVGGADPRVPPAHSRALYRALFQYLKVPVELVVYPDEPHGLTTRGNRLAKMKWDLAWFDRYLLGTTDTETQD